MPSKFVEGVYPIYLESGYGAYVTDGEGNEFIDYSGALGGIVLGHANERIVEALINRAYDGNLFIFPSRLETTLAEKLCKIIPCCEMVRFVKTGSEATSAAIKIARAYTGRDHVAFCGYHGWHDWYTVNTPKKAGIPEDYEKYTHKFEFNNIESLKKIFIEYPLTAAVILEPCIFEAPKDDFLKKVIKVAHQHGALVIFDEVVTGFRTPGFSAQKFFKVKPDLSTFGKCMANGVPISFVCGKRKVMEVLKGDCFVSSTFGGDLFGVSAALETINIMETEPVLDHIWYWGQYLKDGYNEISKDLGIETECVGYPNRTFFKFPSPEHKSLFWQECILRGVLFSFANFMTYSHGQREVEYTIEVILEALKVLKTNWSKPVKALKGKVAQETLRTIATKKT